MTLREEMAKALYTEWYKDDIAATKALGTECGLYGPWEGEADDIAAKKRAFSGTRVVLSVLLAHIEAGSPEMEETFWNAYKPMMDQPGNKIRDCINAGLVAAIRKAMEG